MMKLRKLTNLMLSNDGDEVVIVENADEKLKAINEGNIRSF